MYSLFPAHGYITDYLKVLVVLQVVNTVFIQELSYSENQTNFHFPLIHSLMGFLLIKFQENETSRKILFLRLWQKQHVL